LSSTDMVALSGTVLHMHDDDASLTHVA
jgi:hypothetical protein